MTGKADIIARIAAVGYTLVIAAMVWFTFAFFGFAPPRSFNDVVGMVVFALIAVTPIPVCILCFRRD